MLMLSLTLKSHLLSMIFQYMLLIRDVLTEILCSTLSLRTAQQEFFGITLLFIISAIAILHIEGMAA